MVLKAIKLDVSPRKGESIGKRPKAENSKTAFKNKRGYWECAISMVGRNSSKW